MAPFSSPRASSDGDDDELEMEKAAEQRLLPDEEHDSDQSFTHEKRLGPLHLIVLTCGVGG